MSCLCRNRREAFETSALEVVRDQQNDPATLTPGKSQHPLYVEKTTWASGPI